MALDAVAPGTASLGERVSNIRTGKLDIAKRPFSLMSCVYPKSLLSAAKRPLSITPKITIFSSMSCGLSHYFLKAFKHN